MGWFDGWFGPSKADKDELAYLQERKEKIENANREEMAILQQNQQAQTEKMNSDLEALSNNVNKLNGQITDTSRKHEEELLVLRADQKKREADLEKKRAKELESLQNASEEDKRKVNEDFRLQMEQMQKEHEAATKAADEALAAEKSAWEQKLKSVEDERKVLQRQKMAEAMSHRKNLEAMSKKHREDVEKHYVELRETMEQQTMAEIERAAEETRKKLKMVEDSSAAMQANAIKSTYQNFFLEYCSIWTRAKQLDSDIGSLEACIEPNNDTEGFPYELRDAQSNFNSTATLLTRQVDLLRQRMTSNFDISEDFKTTLMTPLNAYEKSCDSVRDVNIIMMRAASRNSMASLEPVKSSLVEHRKVVTSTVKAMQNVDLKGYVQQTMTEAARKAVTN